MMFLDRLMKCNTQSHVRSRVAVTLLFWTTAWLPVHADLARPLRNSLPMSVLLCKFSDSPTPINGIDFYRRFFTGATGLQKYWQDISDGAIDLDGSVVRGWYTIDKTIQAANSSMRDIKINDCVNQARKDGYTRPDNHILVVVTSPGIDAFGYRGVTFLAEGMSLSLASHETGHGMGFSHSFSEDTRYCNADWALAGEYGNWWDVMSHAATLQRLDVGEFRAGGPGLNAYHLDRMGWIPIDRIFRFGADGVYDQTITLAAPTVLSPGSSYQMVRIPFDPFDLQRYYTIEYRVKQDWDSGFPSDVVLIHEISKKNFTGCSGGTFKGEYRSYLLNDHSTKRAKETMTDRDGITIILIRKNPSSGTAVVRVQSTQPERCIVGFVWREAGPSDRVCVTVNRRTQVQAENDAANNTRDPSGGAFGQNTCKQGYVWREAFANDFVCVVPTSRTEAQTENNEAYWKRIGFAAYGPLNCKQGFVWREADKRDYVCVSLSRRTQVRIENDNADTNREPGGGSFGPDTCKQGFVWREAFAGDHVCVVPESRSLVKSENENRGSTISSDPYNNAAASAGECVDLDECEMSQPEVFKGPPLARDDSAITNQGIPVVIDVVKNDTDVDGDLVTSSALLKSGPSNGTVEAMEDGAFIYTPDQEFIGTDSFIYEICNTVWMCAQATVTVRIEEISCCATKFILFRPICWLFNLLLGECLF